jgi:hypothetical protein
VCHQHATHNRHRVNRQIYRQNPVWGAPPPHPRASSCLRQLAPPPETARAVPTVSHLALHPRPFFCYCTLTVPEGAVAMLLRLAAPSASLACLLHGTPLRTGRPGRRWRCTTKDTPAVFGARSFALPLIFTGCGSQAPAPRPPREHRDPTRA